MNEHPHPHTIHAPFARSLTNPSRRPPPLPERSHHGRKISDSSIITVSQTMQISRLDSFGLGNPDLINSSNGDEILGNLRNFFMAKFTEANFIVGETSVVRNLKLHEVSGKF